MKVTVEIVYAAPSQSHDIEVSIKDGLVGARFMNAIERAVEKHMESLAKENAGANNWKRWNLRSAT